MQAPLCRTTQDPVSLAERLACGRVVPGLDSNSEGGEDMASNHTIVTTADRSALQQNHSVLSEAELPATAGPFTDGELALVLGELIPSDPVKGWVAYYRFEMQVAGEVVGRVAVRAARTHLLDHYVGQIGYTVEPAHRGHRYAARSVRLLMPFARQLDMGTMWITCDPRNAASRRSCELAGATFVEIVPLPEDTDMYRVGDRERCRYRIDL